MKLLFLLLILCNLFSCTSTNTFCDYKNYMISQEEIFSFSNEYLVLIYLDKCQACRDIKLKLTNYYCLNKDKYAIYYLDFLNTTLNENEISNSNIGIEDENKIYIKTVPHLLKINNKTIIEEWVGFTSISKYIESIW